jgi:hypothetical protein
MSLRERTRPGSGLSKRVRPQCQSHARYSDFRRDPFTNHRGDARLSFFRDALRAVIALRLVLQLERVPCLPQ